MNRQRASSVLWGIALIALGVIFAFRTFGILEFDIFFDGWWTLFIIVPSIIDLVKKGLNISSLISLAVGILLFLSAQEIIEGEVFWKLLIPVILVIIGLKLIFKEAFDKTVSAIKSINQSDNKDFTAVFGEQNYDFTGEEFKGADIDAVFGAVTLNLRNATVNGDAVINVSCIFGGASIIVPGNVKVKIASTPVFGGVSNKTVPSFTADAPTLYIRATCLFGGVEIK